MRAHVQLITKEKKEKKRKEKEGGGDEVKGLCGSGEVLGLSRDLALIIAGNIGIIEPAL